MDATYYITAWNALVKTFLGVFTQPTGRVFARLLVGWILCTGRHTATGILRQADPANAVADSVRRRSWPGGHGGGRRS